MAKKKSKTQKYKKNLKKKMNKSTKVEQQTEKRIENKPIKEKQLVEKKKENYNVPLAGSNTSQNKNVKKNSSNYNRSRRNPNKKKQLVEKSKVKYNVPLTEPNLKKVESSKSSEKVNDFSKSNELNGTKKSLIKKNNISEDDIKSKDKKPFLLNFSDKIRDLVKKNRNDLINKKKKKTKEEIVLPKKAKKVDNKKNVLAEKKKKNVFIRLIYEIITNIHIIFNSALIIFFIVLLVGMIRIEVLKTGTIIYISLIVLFLSLIALSYTKYMSGKIFTVLLCAGMGFAIYRMQYTYDFVRNLVSNVYEYKTYYVVTFDNGVNKSIYTINNKSVGLLKDNSINVERRLNTKLDGVNYLEYDDINLLFEDFYDSKYRAILVNENQYKYLQNNIQGQNPVKILYEFKVNEKK